MSNEATLEQLEQKVAELPPDKQLKLVAHITEQLSVLPLVAATEEEERRQQQARLREVDAWLVECSHVAELWEGEFDSAADLRRIRDEG